MQDLAKLPTIDFAYELVIDSPRIVYTRREKLWSVYLIRNLLKGRVYIGRTTNPKSRAMNHFSAIKRKTHSNIIDYEDDYEFVILADKLKMKEAAEKELYYMKAFKSYNPKFGYNTKDNHFYQKGKPTSNLLQKEVM